MVDFLQTTNYLTPQKFYHDFLDWIVLQDEFHNDEQKPPMSANQFYWLARIQYGSALRIGEGLKLIKSDFDLEHRIIKTRNPKTDKKGVQKTSILPYDIKPIEKFLNGFKDDEQLFPITRSTAWRYYKNASILGGMNIYEMKPHIEIENAWTHLLRSSCAKMYEDAGASFSLIQVKLRHSYGGTGMAVTERYIRRDLPSLIRFDEEHFHEFPKDDGSCSDKPILEVIQS